MLPKDPEILYSFLNLKLRDNYSSLEALCEDMDVSLAEITETMKKAGYVYDEGGNRFVCG